MCPLRSSFGIAAKERNRKSFAFGVGLVRAWRGGTTVRIFAVSCNHNICNNFRPSHVDDNDDNNNNNKAYEHASVRTACIHFFFSSRVETSASFSLLCHNQTCDKIGRSILSISIYKTVHLTGIYKQKFLSAPWCCWADCVRQCSHQLPFGKQHKSD